MRECIGLPPSIDDTCRILILGSMPGVASLQAQQYYAHPQNRFWPMISRILQENALPAKYEQRLLMLRRHHIALWDSIGSCQRDGSLDSAIKEALSNDFPALFKQYPNIRKVCFNGAKSFEAFKKHHKALLNDPHRTFLPLPSTSPANARWRLPMLEAAWRKALLE